MKIIFKFLILFFIIIFLFLFFYFIKYFFTQNIKKVCFKNNCFNVSVAKTDSEREKGLMFKKELPENHGMLFVFDKEADCPFWMKNTLINLDIIWLDKNGKIVFIKQNAEPCKKDPCEIIDPKINAKYVLEINAGVSQKINLKIGELVQITPGL